MIPIYQVDAFTSKPYAGNPAGVCLLDKPRPDEWMRLFAREMNLSETAFLMQEGDGFRLRWFTPKVEVDLCGHATLASAHILFELGKLKLDQVAKFYTRSGLLTATKSNDWIELNFPSRPVQQISKADDVANALKVEPVFVGKNVDDYLVEVETEAQVRSLQPDFDAITRLPVRGIILTSRSSTPEYDFISRFFAPAVGVPEDPVTGSAHTCLTPYWHEKLGKSSMLAYQASERGGVLSVHQMGDRVKICGQAVTIFSGQIYY